MAASLQRRLAGNFTSVVRVPQTIDNSTTLASGVASNNHSSLLKFTEVLQGTTTDSFTTTTSDLVSTTIRNFTNSPPGIVTAQLSTVTTLTANSTSFVEEFLPEAIADSGLGTAEQVVIGAAGLVAALAVFAIILRVVMPTVRQGEKDTASQLKSDLLTPPDRKFSTLSGYTNIAADLSSQSSGSTGSNPSTEWSEAESSQTRSTICSEDNQIAMAGSYGNIRGSSLSLPVYLPGEKTGSSIQGPRRLNDELMSVISTKSLEPIKMGDSYRNRWDDEWDPYGSLPRSDSLSHHSHPSESSQPDVRFPTPSKEDISRMATDKDRRYPSTREINNIRKERAVRVAAPKRV